MPPMKLSLVPELSSKDPPISEPALISKEAPVAFCEPTNEPAVKDTEPASSEESPVCTIISPLVPLVADPVVIEMEPDVDFSDVGIAVES